MRASREFQYQRNVTFSPAVGWIKKLMILDSTNWVESQEKGKKVELMQELLNDRLSELTWGWGKKSDLFNARRKFSAEIGSQWSLTEKTERWQSTCQLCLASTCKSHLQPLKSAQFSKVTWQFDVRIEFLSRCFSFCDRNVLTPLRLLQSLAILWIEYSEKHLYLCTREIRQKIKWKPQQALYPFRKQKVPFFCVVSMRLACPL